MHSPPLIGLLHIFYLLVCQVGAQAAGRYASQEHPLSRPVTQPARAEDERAAGRPALCLAVQAIVLRVAQGGKGPAARSGLAR